MHVVVVGCGRVGSGLAGALESQGHSVAIIDKRESAFRRLPANFSGQALVGVGFHRPLLVSAGIEKADALAAVTSGDNSNILVARVAREAFGIERVVARIYDARRAAIYERLGIPTVATVSWAIERTLRKIDPTAPSVEWIDPSAKICLIERAVPASFAGRTIEQLEAEGGLRVAGLTRLGESQVPMSAASLQQGDVLWLTVAGDRIDELDRVLGIEPGPSSTVGAH
jgi:trk system potassium uptake protein TrkA